MEIHFLILGHIILYALCVCTSKIGSYIYQNIHKKESEEFMKKEGINPWLMVKIQLFAPFVMSLFLFIPLEIIYWTLVLTI